jgi:hypothetical protein
MTHGAVITGPLLFGRLISDASKDDPSKMMIGYGLGASLMIAAGIVEIFLGIEAAQKELEDIAKPLTAEDAEGAEVARALDMGEDKETVLDRADHVADKLTAPTEHAGGSDAEERRT